VRAFAADSGKPWRTHALEVTGHASNDGPRARFRIALLAPSSEASASILLHDALVAHEVISHYIYIYLRSDWATGQAQSQPQLVGTIHAGPSDITIARTGSFLRGLRSTVLAGMQHITTGSDHLMFLFALMLVVPVAAVGGSWSARRSMHEAALALVRTVSAFTLGHSITLALGAFDLFRVPAASVEVAIALSVLATAVHALRPIFPQREASLVAAFGLVHGLAFANTLHGRDLGAAQTVWTLLGFNTGIELAQLTLLFLVVPWVLLLARTRAYDAFRVLSASSAVLLALGWLLERTTPFKSPTSVPLAWLEAHPLYLLCALAISALAARVQLRGASINVSHAERQ
jgi:hypothetical protein